MNKLLKKIFIVIRSPYSAFRHEIPEGLYLIDAKYWSTDYNKPTVLRFYPYIPNLGGSLLEDGIYYADEVYVVDDVMPSELARIESSCQEQEKKLIILECLGLSDLIKTPTTASDFSRKLANALKKKK